EEVRRVGLVRRGRISHNIDISIDPFTARNPFYCFIDLPDEVEVSSATSTLKGKEFLGRPVKIKPCLQPQAYPMNPESKGRIFNQWH
ncbi:hypothetical protein K469DRAFT_118608, partial [Zopfia rhizophila CBS 207.26]